MSLIGFTKIGITKFSLASFIHSKIGIVTAKSLFSYMQSFGASCVLTTYAPIVVPTAVSIYAGYHFYQRKKSKNATSENNKAEKPS